MKKITVNLSDSNYKALIDTCKRHMKYKSNDIDQMLEEEQSDMIDFIFNSCVELGCMSDDTLNKCISDLKLEMED